jgi:phage terminase small subunit
MGKRGPKKTPTATLAQRGSWRAKERKAEPEAGPLAALPDPPGDMPDAAAVYWRNMAPTLHASGRLKVDDLPAFGRYCRAMARFVELDGMLDVSDRAWIMNMRDLHTMLREYDARFGLTPSDRAEMALPDRTKDSEGEGKSRFFGGPRVVA